MPYANFNYSFQSRRHWSMALLISCWSRLAQQVCTLSLRSSKPKIGTLYTSCCRALQTAQSTGFTRAIPKVSGLDVLDN